MKSNAIIITLIALFACGLAAQETEKEPLDSSRLQLEFVRIEQPQRIFHTLQELYGRNIEVREDGRPRFVENLMLLGNNIIVHDTPENVKRIVLGIHLIVAETQEDQLVAPVMVRKEVVPEYISIDEAVMALGPLARRRTDTKVKAGYDNITVVESQGMIIFHDLESNIEEICKIIALVDRPQQQVMIRCRIIQGVPNSKVPDSGLSRLLPPELKELTRCSTFKILAAGAIRTSATNGRPILMEMAGSDEVRAVLSINPGGYSPESQTLRLNSIELHYEGPMPETMLNTTTNTVTQSGMARRDRQNLQTSTTLPAGEVVVIGALGENPIFVVLEMSPIKN